MPPPSTPPEKRGDIQFSPKDAGLRKDVHDLGVIVGQLLEEQGGPALFGRVEQARRAAIAAREGDAAGAQRLEALVADIGAAPAAEVIRQFQADALRQVEDMRDLAAAGRMDLLGHQARLVARAARTVGLAQLALAATAIQDDVAASAHPSLSPPAMARHLNRGPEGSIPLPPTEAPPCAN